MPTKLPFVFSQRGYIYQSGLDCIRLAARSGQNSLQEAISSKEMELKTYEEGGVFVGERDEDGDVLWEKNEILELDIERLQEALLELRRSFVLTAYHYWETSVYKWHHQENPKTKPVNLGNYEKLKRALEAFGQKDPALKNIPNDNLFIVCHLSNIIKHTSGNSEEYLSKNMPVELSGTMKSDPEIYGGRPQIYLEEHHLKWIFDVIAKSGPIANPNRV
ncbi:MULTISPECIES: hypothetical protein [Acetobacter]|uniref:hypothetical protein n=1 Tax=Acetobacter TaxID=434 RepID=UPI000FFDC47A|nr:hypothetical protein [Acetobacter pasteurianus]GCD50897.1 hypothetical protein NBRC106471_2453 [Acetobacter pasteurianus subsp. pasteurianus LMG 1262 = NBRC 106471]